MCVWHALKITHIPDTQSYIDACAVVRADALWIMVSVGIIFSIHISLQDALRHVSVMGEKTRTSCSFLFVAVVVHAHVHV